MVQNDSVTAGQVLDRVVGAVATEAEDCSLLFIFFSHPVSVLCLVFSLCYTRCFCFDLCLAFCKSVLKARVKDMHLRCSALGGQRGRWIL